MAKFLYQLVFDLKNKNSDILQLNDYCIPIQFLLKNASGNAIPCSIKSTIKNQRISFSNIRFFCDYIIETNKVFELFPLPNLKNQNRGFHEIIESNSHYKTDDTDVPYYTIYKLNNGYELWENSCPQIIKVQETKKHQLDEYSDLSNSNIEFVLVRRSITDINLNIYDC